MRIKVTEQGVTIPKSLLPDVDEVDIRKRNGVLEVMPIDVEDVGYKLSSSPMRENRKGKGVLKDEPYPLSALGRNPIPKDELDIKDASVNLDKYVYGE